MPIVVAAPALTFPLTFPLLTAIILAVAATFATFTVRRDIAEGRKLDTPLLIPWIVLLASVLVGAVISRFPYLTIPKLCGVILGMLTLRAVLLTATAGVRLWTLGWLYLAGGCATILGGVLASPQWPRKYLWLYGMASTIPPVVRGLPGAEEGVNPNALGATTLLFLPVAATLTMVSLRHPATSARARAGALAAFIGLLGVLVLTQSRTAWVSAVAAGGLLVALRSRVTAAICAIGAVSIAAAAWWMGLATLLGTIQKRSLPIWPYVTNEDRTAIWSMALEKIKAHPVTGVGLGTFRELVRTTNIRGEPAVVPHAHNTFLQVTLDTGFPGLAAYVALLAIATAMTWQILESAADSRLKALVAGLWGGLAAIHLFGLTDAIALGAKVGVFLWWNLALIAAAWKLTLKLDQP